MVNANVVISVSAVLVAVILTIVFVMRKNGDPADNFSVSVGGSIDGNPAGMYYCIGQACQFYGSLPAATPDFPGYFALVGFTMGGDTYLTEHSIGKTFKFDSAGTLRACFESQKLDSAALTAQVDALKAANAGDGKYTVGGNTFTQTSYSLSKDPASDRPAVLGFSVPTVAECEAVWRVPGVDHDPSVGFGPEEGFDPNFQPPARHLSDERTLYNKDNFNAKNSAWAREASGIAYDGKTLGKSDHFVMKSCVHDYPLHWGAGSAVARFIYDSSKSTMAISFAGSDNAYDFVLDLTKDGVGSPSDLHWGFWKYVELLQVCVNSYVDELWKANIDIDYLVGHSLGGAAAVVYKRMYGGRLGLQTSVLDTWAGPKTTKQGLKCRFTGKRRFDEKDPVAGNGLGVMGGLLHDVTSAQKGYQGSVCTWSFFGGCLSSRTTYDVAEVGCTQESGGCDWFFDCVFNVHRHALSNYANYNFGA